MKKILGLVTVVVLAGFSPAWAGHFIDVLPPASATGCTPVSNGYDYNCTNDTGAPAVILSGPLTPFVRTVAQIGALTPTTTGQLLIISNPATFNAGTFGVCISSGIGVGAWIQVSSATAVSACK